ncbi:MAG: PQQ-dependent sugar dehydrogenase [Nocardioides sp.]
MSLVMPVPTILLTLGLLASGLAAGATSAPSSKAAQPAAATPTASAARAVPAGFTQRTVMRRLPRATDMAFAPDGRLFVTLKSGVVRYRRTNGSVARLLNFSRKVNDTGERGLLGIAVDPRFATNHHLFLVYTHRATGTLPIHNRLVRVTVRNGRLAPGSERLLFRFNGQRRTNHVGGSVQVGRDGKLYVSHGENGRDAQAQSLDNVLGKIVRLNRNGTIPADNPFFNRANGRNRAIWARGLRNPFKFAFDPRRSRGFINDVGAQTWEEINRLRKGGNYGWPTHEGPESAQRFIPPIFAYRHAGAAGSTGCSITGGEFYRPARRNFPARFVGDYFFADFCNGWVRRYDRGADRATPFATGLGSPVDLEVDRLGALYVLVHGTPGRVVRIRSNR